MASNSNVECTSLYSTLKAGYMLGYATEKSPVVSTINSPGPECFSYAPSITPAPNGLTDEYNVWAWIYSDNLSVSAYRFTIEKLNAVLLFVIQSL